MTDDRVFMLTMSFDDQSADCIMILSDGEGDQSESKRHLICPVPRHQDNPWHVVRDLLIDLVGECF